jgi:hypothetical protein
MLCNAKADYAEKESRVRVKMFKYLLPLFLVHHDMLLFLMLYSSYEHGECTTKHTAHNSKISCAVDIRSAIL